MTKKRVPVPAWLSHRGEAFWSAATSRYELTPGEEALLLEACRTLDRLEALNVAIVEQGVLGVGSSGQTVTNSLLTEARGQQVVLHRLLAALSLPEDEIEAATTTRSRTGAQARWKDELTEARLKRGGA